MSDILSFISMFFEKTWDFFTEINFPGLGMSLAVILVGLFLASFGFRILGYIFGFSLGDFERVNKRITKAKISKERQADER